MYHFDSFIANNHEVTKVRKRAKIRNRYNQASHLTKDTNIILKCFDRICWLQLWYICDIVKRIYQQKCTV